MGTQLMLRICTLLMLVGAFGCRTYPTYWIDQSNMETGTPLKMDQAYIAPNAAEAMTSRTLMVHVLPVPQTFNPAISKYGTKTDWALFRPKVEGLVADELWRSRVFSDVSATSDVQPMLRTDLRLDVAITGWDEGNGWIRYLLPGFVSPVFRLAGTGPTRMQWEGRMVDTRTGALVLTFADKRIHPGGGGIFTFKAFKGNVLIGEDIIASTKLLAKGIRKVTGTKAKLRTDEEWRNRYHKRP